jgi:hypothetical protein
MRVEEEGEKKEVESSTNCELSEHGKGSSCCLSCRGEDKEEEGRKEMKSKTLTMTSFSLLSSTMRVVTPVLVVCAAAVACPPAVAALAAASVSVG